MSERERRSPEVIGKKSTSKVILTLSNFSELQSGFPESSDVPMSVDEAKKARAESNVTGVYEWLGETRYRYRFITKSDNKFFNIDCSDWDEAQFTPAFYERLIQEIELILDQDDLLIILY